MKYQVELKPRAVKDMKSLTNRDAMRVVNALETLSDGLNGDVKKLTNVSPEYRLRIGSYRVLFEIVTPDLIIVYRIRHRREIYRYGN